MSRRRTFQALHEKRDYGNLFDAIDGRASVQCVCTIVRRNNGKPDLNCILCKGSGRAKL